MENDKQNVNFIAEARRSIWTIRNLAVQHTVNQNYEFCPEINGEKLTNDGWCQKDDFEYDLVAKPGTARHINQTYKFCSKIVSKKFSNDNFKADARRTVLKTIWWKNYNIKIVWKITDDWITAQKSTILNLLLKSVNSETCQHSFDYSRNNNLKIIQKPILCWPQSCKY